MSHLYELEQELRELMRKYNAAIAAEDDPELHSDYRNRATAQADDINRRIQEIEAEIEAAEETWEERFARHAACGGED